MPSARFYRDYTFVPDEDRRMAIKYKSNITYHNVRRQCVDKAVAAYAAIEVPAPLRRRKSRSKNK